jgi:hypothetical protein
VVVQVSLGGPNGQRAAGHPGKQFFGGRLAIAAR